MNHKDDEKLLMIYFNETDDKTRDDGLQSPEVCDQLNQLEADMNAIERAAEQQHPLAEDYGQQLWERIADRLDDNPGIELPRLSWWQKLQNYWLMPQYSLASFALVIGLVLVSFYVGKNQTDDALNRQLQEQLLAQNIQLHLTQSEIFLTQVSNGNGAFNSQATAQRLLSSNRLFKRALAQHDSQFTSQLLQDLEPILLEYANGSAAGNPNQTHGQPRVNWVKDSSSSDLMFQIKTMKQQLAQTNDLI
ncbi:hypothetical protein [Marinicella meishanensis]|uniref:hypothetical protein n=1 Tax=Marinicella meishanensis TaxID=2873263 RepID=UPI001CBDF551|nr:hypothetical protein [Marinicella sp. NBU2979]